MESRKLEKTTEPGIFKRGNRYVVMYRDGFGRQHKRAAGATMKEARDTKARLRADVSRGEDTEATRENFATYATRWIESYAGRNGSGIREETRRDYKRVLEQDAVPFLGHVRLSQIRQKHLDELAARIAARGVAPATVKLALAPVKTLLACAYAAGDLRVNPASGWRARYEQATVEKTDDQTDDEIKALTDDQLATLLAEIPEEWRLFYTFLAQTGLRISEAIELRWRDVEFGTVNTFKVTRRLYRGRVAPPKSKYGRRTIRLTSSMAQSLWVLRGDPDELVFTGARGGRIDQSNLMSRVLKPAAARVGLGAWIPTSSGARAESWVGHHTFRHTCATLLFVNGWNAKQVQVWLGHHSPAFTLATYVHLLPNDLPELPDAFSEWGNKGVTQHTETDRNAAAVKGSGTAQTLALARAV